MANDLLTAQELRSGWTWIKAFPRRAWHLLLGLWRQERRRLLVMAAGVLVAVIVLAALGTGGAEIWDITTTLALGAVVLAVSRDHRTIGAVIVTCLALSLVGTLAGPRWSPVAVKDSLVPSTTDTRIGGDVETAPVGSYEVATSQVTITQTDGEEVPALLRRPVGVDEPTPGVVFLHGAGTHTQAGFAEQAEALASAGATTLVPNKPTENYSLTERDYVSMAADYEQSLVYLRGLDGVDSGRVGVYAESEGGYPGVILAGTDPQVAFLVLASAPVVMIRQQATYAAGSYLKRVGVPDALLDAAARLLGSRELPRGAFDYADFDARPYEEKITAPVLMLYGTGDSSMPLVQGPATIWDSIRKAGNTQLTVRYYDGANHGLKLGTTTDGPLAPGVARDLSVGHWPAGHSQRGAGGGRGDAGAGLLGAGPWACPVVRLGRPHARRPHRGSGAAGGSRGRLGDRAAAATAGQAGPAPAGPDRTLVGGAGPVRTGRLGAVPGVYRSGSPAGPVLLLQPVHLLRGLVRGPDGGLGERHPPGQALRADLAHARPRAPREAERGPVADSSCSRGPVRSARRYPGPAGGPGLLGPVSVAVVSLVILRPHSPAPKVLGAAH